MNDDFYEAVDVAKIKGAVAE
ncbi:MAG: hypothetical protein ACK40T_10455 [Akkermansiaceae bacterium]